MAGRRKRGESFPREQKIALIKAVQAHTVLWDITDKMHFNALPSHLGHHLKCLRQEWCDHRNSELINKVVFVDIHPGTPGLVAPYIDSNKGNDHLREILEELNKAKYSIDIALYAMSSNELGTLLCDVTKRGVKVRLLSDNNFSNLYNKYCKYLDLRKVNLSSDNSVMMHHKILIIDGFKRVQELKPDLRKKPPTVCITGSMNLVFVPKSCDNMLITANPKVVKRLEQEFMRMWNLVMLKAQKRDSDYNNRSNYVWS